MQNLVRLGVFSGELQAEAEAAEAEAVSTLNPLTPLPLMALVREWRSYAGNVNTTSSASSSKASVAECANQLEAALKAWAEHEKELRELSEKATAGPWVVGDSYECFCVFAPQGKHDVVRGLDARLSGKQIDGPICIDIQEPETAQFIVACVNYVRGRVLGVEDSERKQKEAI